MLVGKSGRKEFNEKKNSFLEQIYAAKMASKSFD